MAIGLQDRMRMRGRFRWPWRCSAICFSESRFSRGSTSSAQHRDETGGGLRLPRCDRRRRRHRGGCGRRRDGARGRGRHAHGHGPRHPAVDAPYPARCPTSSCISTRAGPRHQRLPLHDDAPATVNVGPTCGGPPRATARPSSSIRSPTDSSNCRGRIPLGLVEGTDYEECTRDALPEGSIALPPPTASGRPRVKRESSTEWCVWNRSSGRMPPAPRRRSARPSVPNSPSAGRPSRTTTSPSCS